MRSDSYLHSITRDLLESTQHTKTSTHHHGGIRTTGQRPATPSTLRRTLPQTTDTSGPTPPRTSRVQWMAPLLLCWGSFTCSTKLRWIGFSTTILFLFFLGEDPVLFYYRHFRKNSERLENLKSTCPIDRWKKLVWDVTIGFFRLLVAVPWAAFNNHKFEGSRPNTQSVYWDCSSSLISCG